MSRISVETASERALIEQSQKDASREAYITSLFIGVLACLVCFFWGALTANPQFLSSSVNKDTTQGPEILSQVATSLPTSPATVVSAGTTSVTQENDTYTDTDIQTGRDVVTDYFSAIDRGDAVQAYSLLDDYRTSRPGYTVDYYSGVIAPIQAIEDFDISYIGTYQHPGDPETYLRYAVTMTEVREDGRVTSPWHVTVGRYQGRLAVHLMDRPENF